MRNEPVEVSSAKLEVSSLALNSDKNTSKILLKNDNILSKIPLKNDKNFLKIPLNFDNLANYDFIRN